MIATRVVLAYALLGAAWILLSDQILQHVFGLEANELVTQSGKSWVSVTVIALALYLLLRHLAERFAGRSGESARPAGAFSNVIGLAPAGPSETAGEPGFSGFTERFRHATGIDPAELSNRRREDSPASWQAARQQSAQARAIAAAEAQETQARLAAILQVTPDVVATADTQGRILFLNSAGRRLAGIAEQSALPTLRLTDLLPPAATGRLSAEILPQAARDGAWSGESTLYDSSGRELPALMTVLAHPRADGSVAYYSLVARDLSEQRETEARFARSRRLEAIGQLSAGIAHDFNNLLLVILGNAEVLDSGHQGDPRLSQAVRLIRQASTRAAELTDRLLAFARQRSLKPQPVRLDRTVGDMMSLLQRALSEEVQVEIALDPLLGPVFVDRSELETTLINLAINARDAMPRGGRLSIAAENLLVDAQGIAPPELSPGQYVVIAVSDTGTGMSRETLERACEPFFTTKGPGQGTGLGLAMAFGFTRQSGGHLAIYSELGRGTTVRLYLPRHQEEAPLRLAPAPTDSAPAPCGNERVLLVEDEPLVRQFVETQLGGLGYRVVSAGNGDEAMAVLERDCAFDLLLTDIVMPGALKGPEIAAEARRLCPAIQVIYTTGYAQQVALAQAGLPADAPVLSKPYRRAALARLVRSVLDAPHRAPAAN
jgi:PAS domain S-box-containing protein